MAINNFQLGFTEQSTHQVPIRNRPDRYNQTPLAQRARFEVSEGQRPAEYFAPAKDLPVLQKDVTTDDYIVMPKGKIVSSARLLAGSANVSQFTTGSGIFGFTSAVTGNAVSYNEDESYFGYDEYISNLLIPANGGAATNLYYTGKDVLAGTYKYDGVLAADGDILTSLANAPIGVTFHDWYQDIRGKYLNYKMWPDGGHVLCDWYVEVPFVVEDVADSGGQVAGLSGVFSVQATAADNYARRAEFSAISDKFSYLSVQGSDTFQPGVFIQSDAIGNYKIQGNLTANRTAQTVGKLVGIDTRYPKSGLEDVLTYPGSRMPGSQTGGLPSFLFEFIVACETAEQIVYGTNYIPTIEDVLNYAKSGKYGIARIQLSVS